MGLVETKVRRETWDVDRRLAELGLVRSKLLKVAAAARGASADSTPFHPVNAAGTFAYQHGTWALRSEFVGNAWVLDRADGIEAIRNIHARAKLAYANVDIACNDAHSPKPRSRKGSGSERACLGNLFDNLPQFAPSTDEVWAAFYLMVDENGAAELSRPVVRGGAFSTCSERNYLGGGDIPGDIKFNLEDDEPGVDFDPQVARKTG
jgi:hypothetical protein